ncbi:Pantothenate transporter [Lachnellula willkommii]|uniref:Pantothenate transporter n=1 Tax=Lachnellula willkommii TaxID=215461 RepID=A0A559MEI9_9HELO|nr:Pantothenate transporter [Lachnellula willkommii]
MKEDLHLTGNRLNYINAAYEVGYVVFQVPSNILVTKYPAHYYLPAVEIFWGIFTLGTAFVNTYEQLVVMRFFVGLSSTACYIGCLTVISSWYKKNELGRRNALFWCANPLGTMFAGYLQAAAYTNLNGHSGLQGWRWLFIICTVITIPIAFVGFFFFPDTADTTTTRWLSDSEKALAKSRIEADGFMPSKGVNLGLFKRCLKRLDFYIFVPLTVIFFTCLYGYNTPYILWLKSQKKKYSIPMVNNLGTVSSAVGVVTAISVSYYTDITGSRWEAALLAGVVCVFSNIVLAVWKVPYGLHFFSYLALGAAHGIGPLLVTWTGEALADDLETRSIVFAVQNTLGEVAGLVAACISALFLGNAVLIALVQRSRKNRAKGLGTTGIAGEETAVSANDENDLTQKNTLQVAVVANDHSEVK